MNKLWYVLLAALFAACLTACGSSASSTGGLSAGESSTPQVTADLPPSESAPAGTDSEPSSGSAATSATSNEESEEETNMESNTFYVRVGGETFSATFAENVGAQALKELLAGGDITIKMSDYGGFEKVGTLGQSLPTSNSQTTTQAGDIVLYQGNQIVIFYGSNSWSYTRLGRIDDLTGWEAALEGSTVSVTFSLRGE